MKKALFVLLDLLSIAFLIGAYVIQYFTKRKLGMLRWVTFQVSQMKEVMPVDLLKYIAVIVVLLLTAMIVGGFMKKRKSLEVTDMVMVVVLIILTAIYLGVTIFVTTEMIRSYYLVLPMLGAASLMLVIRNGFAVWMCKDEK